MRSRPGVGPNAASALRGARRVVAIGAVCSLALAACGHSRDAKSPAAPAAPETPASPTRVLLIGDSIMDQEGAAATFLLRQAGIDATTVAHWGSGLFTRSQYDHGRPILTPPAHPFETHWLSLAATLVAQKRPALVVVALNHNFPPPYPRDANGNEITDLRSAAGRAMIATQTTTLLGILRRDGARVAFVTPPPDGTEHAPTDNAIWAGTLPVLQAQHVDVIDIAPAVAGSAGGRVETAPDCRGDAVAIRKAGEVHYTRYGAGRAGTVLARGIAGLLHRTLPDDAAPGDHAVALVPTRRGRGYWIVQCDGSVYRFGDATPADGVVGSHDVPFVGAVAAPKRGLWLVARNGDVVATGGAPALTFATATPTPVVAATVTSDGNGVAEVTADGVVRSNETGASAHAPIAHVVAITTRAGGGYWVVNAAGTVVGVGAPPLPGSGPSHPVAAAAATPTGDGLWLAGADGSVAARGTATMHGDALPPTLPPSVAKVLPPSPLPAVVAIVASPKGGYWILRDNGEVIARGAAPALGDTAALALFTD